MRRRPFAALILAAASLLALASCGRKPAPALPDSSHIPDITGWHPIGGLRPSFAGPHRGSLQRTFLNPEAFQALSDNAFQPWPDGTQLVKEALNQDGTRLAWFWMSKEKGQWVWAQAAVDGRVAWRQRGLDTSCAACHMKNAKPFDGAFAPVWAGKGRLHIGASSSP